MNTKELESKSIPELKALYEQIEKLLAVKIEAARDEAVKQIELISQSAGLSVMIRGPRKKKEGQEQDEPKLYRNPNNHEEVWRSTERTKPKWLKAQLKAGNPLSMFEIQETESETDNA